jgi:hypothetical protein
LQVTPSNKQPDELTITPIFGGIDTWCALTDMSRRKTYDLLAEGILHAVKVGDRTLVDIEHGLAYLRELPPASFSRMRRKNPAPQSEQQRLAALAESARRKPRRRAAKVTGEATAPAE